MKASALKQEGGLTIERMVELGGVSRSGFYRFDGSAAASLDPHMDLRDAIQCIALKWPSYGRPRITAELRRRGWTVNPKLVYRLLREEFVFLAVILDAYSRRVIGWALDRIMEDELTLTALRMALARRAVQPGLVHHSDRGSQYASNDYTDLLKANGITISMSRKATRGTTRPASRS